MKSTENVFLHGVRFDLMYSYIKSMLSNIFHRKKKMKHTLGVRFFLEKIIIGLQLYNEVLKKVY